MFPEHLVLQDTLWQTKECVYWLANICEKFWISSCCQPLLHILLIRFVGIRTPSILFIFGWSQRWSFHQKYSTLLYLFSIAHPSISATSCYLPLLTYAATAAAICSHRNCIMAPTFFKSWFTVANAENVVYNGPSCTMNDFMFKLVCWWFAINIFKYTTFPDKDNTTCTSQDYWNLKYRINILKLWRMKAYHI